MAQWMQEWALWPWLAALLGLAFLVLVLALLVRQFRLTRELRAEMGELKWFCQQVMDLASWQDRSKDWGGSMVVPEKAEEIIQLPKSHSNPSLPAAYQGQGSHEHAGIAYLGERDKGRAFVWAAGFSRGPQGPASFGAVLKNSRGETLARMQGPVGKLDRRNAMYQGVAEALAKAKHFGMEKVVVFTSPLGGPKGSRGVQDLPGIREPLRKRLEEAKAGFTQFEWIIVEPPRNREAETLAREQLMVKARRAGQSSQEA